MKIGIRSAVYQVLRMPLQAQTMIKNTKLGLMQKFIFSSELLYIPRIFPLRQFLFAHFSRNPPDGCFEPLSYLLVSFTVFLLRRLSLSSSSALLCSLSHFHFISSSPLRLEHVYVSQISMSAVDWLSANLIWWLSHNIMCVCVVAFMYDAAPCDMEKKIGAVVGSQTTVWGQ